MNLRNWLNNSPNIAQKYITYIGIFFMSVLAFSGLFIMKGLENHQVYVEINQEIDHLADENRKLTQTLLHLNSLMFFDYDQLVNSLERLKSSFQILDKEKVSEAFLDDWQTEALLNSINKKIEQKIEMAEHFKSNHALHINSFNSLPIILLETEHQFGKSYNFADIKRIVLESYIHYSSQQPLLAKEYLKRVTIAHKTLKAPQTEREQLRLLLQHCYNMISYRLKDRQIINQIEQLDINGDIKALSERVNSILWNKNRRDEQIILTLFLFSLLVSITILLLIWFTKKNANLISGKHDRLIHNLDYAKKLQSAIFPSHDTFKLLFKDHAIIYKPKDIVSGDFYAIDHVNGNTIVVSADCASNGVPGALLSIIGKNLIDKIIHDYHILQPHEILFHLDCEIRKILKLDIAPEMDGIDIAICAINQERNTLTFAGAHASAYYVQDGIVSELKGNRYSIGCTVKKDGVKKFNSQTILVQKATSLYLCSNGLKDQYGGTENKRYGNHRLKEVIAKCYRKEMKEQAILFQQDFEQWKGLHQQGDDIMLLGLKIS
ncbi:DAHL domain-containing protein [Limibacter armeniacum]|uniref:SpoIIE family protein phosphatase n=1 Tax=Limibacter armeniacum TaxID=466084 RepID=UPI002FE56329